MSHGLLHQAFKQKPSALLEKIIQNQVSYHGDLH